MDRMVHNANVLRSIKIPFAKEHMAQGYEKLSVWTQNVRENTAFQRNGSGSNEGNEGKSTISVASHMWWSTNEPLVRINEYSEKDQVERLSLCKALLHTAAATESLECEVANNSQKSSQLNPANPAESENGLERVAVTHSIVVATRLVAYNIRKGRRTTEPEDPCNQQNHAVNSDWGSNTAGASEE